MASHPILFTLLFVETMRRMKLMFSEILNVIQAISLGIWILLGLLLVTTYLAMTYQSYRIWSQVGWKYLTVFAKSILLFSAVFWTTIFLVGTALKLGGYG